MMPNTWTVFGMILLVGAIYYFAVQVRKPFEPVMPPEEPA